MLTPKLVPGRVNKGLTVVTGGRVCGVVCICGRVDTTLGEFILTEPIIGLFGAELVLDILSS